MAGKGSNSVHLRHYNERVVLDAIRRFGQASKAEVARFAHLTPPAVAAIIDALVAGGYVIENGKRFGGKGQPSAMYGLARDGAYSIGLHIGRRAMDAILIDFAGQTCAFETHDYDHPDPETIRRIGRAAIARFRAQLGPDIAARLVGIGISAPYFIGGWDEELGFPSRVQEEWRAVDLRSHFVETQGLAVMIENDASAAAVAELVYGIGKQYSDFLHISLSTFVGGGLVLNGTLQTGPNGNTAAFGPFPVTFSSLASVPKPPGKFEVLLHRASIYTLVAHLRFNGFDITRVRDLEPMPAQARALVSEWQDDCADALAQAIIGSIALVDLEAIVIDGLLPASVLVETVTKVRASFAQMLPPGLIAPSILAGSIGPRGSALGASLLPIYSMFGPDTGVLMKKGSDKKPLMVGSA
ncbi:ROK family transcriptional regulator [Kaistia algarum]|uniref:ROK family transcriptional regulator n=1 Tax=Kaistia algarum TaxID=2083279 RepID=UPI000CE74087|nr:ROK family transcriptional regulator [Kaistia algarum]MCX5515780.1 ROK family transcriptional regulator [Kaistia algarum]PPE80845.1 ROK family transcriptional regulator [Kaistia algarum]